MRVLQNGNVILEGSWASIERSLIYLAINRSTLKFEYAPGELQADAIARIDVYAKGLRIKIAGTPDEIEIAAWNNKLVIAKAIKAGTASAGDKAAFQAEINARGKGETVDAFADKVLVNASFYAQAVGLIDGLKRRTQDAVNAAGNPEEVEAVLATMKSQAEAAFAQLMGAAK